jgi:hypothetical protein
MTPPARLRARELVHGFLNWAANVLACRNTMDNHTAECDRLTDVLAPYLEALEVAREALEDIAGEEYLSPDGGSAAIKADAALARIAALTPLETPVAPPRPRR